MANQYQNFIDASPPLPQHIKRKGWIYKDFPKLPVNIWQAILEGLGEGNHQILTEASYTINGVEYGRGQIFCCPKKLEKVIVDLSSTDDATI